MLQRREKRKRKKQRLRKKRGAKVRKGAFKDRRTSGPLPGGATEVLRREVQWTTHRIKTKRTEYACRLVNRQETAEFDPVRDHDHEAVTQVQKVA